MVKKVFLVCVFLFSKTVFAGEEIDLNAINQIRDEGFIHSEAIDYIQYLTDHIGPRLTGSPQMKEAREWASEKFKEWGLDNIHFEPFEFGRGWTMEKSLVMMTSPRRSQLYAVPQTWTIGTEGPVEAPVILAPMESEGDFEKYKGKLEGKIVLLSKPTLWVEPSNEVFKRLGDDDLEKLSEFPIPEESLTPPEDGYRTFMEFKKALGDFLESEGAVAGIFQSGSQGFLVYGDSYLHTKDYTLPIPMMEMASEHYNRLARLSEDEADVWVSFDLETTFYDDDPNGYNTIAEIQGQGRDPEIVMVGAHLDSWTMADGAVDNAVGSAVVMEAMRILSKMPNFKPRRTIRAVLWSGEEQVYFGSINYVREHFAERPHPEKDLYEGFGGFIQTLGQWPITTKPEYNKLSAYFNLDNGSGKIRGIFAERNVAAAAVFEDWFKPFSDLGKMKVVTMTRGQTDHVPFKNVGLPAYQFIQDPLDYESRLHHTQLDTFEHIVPNDVKQAAVIVASFLYLAATRDDPIPRKPFPRQTDEDKKWKAKAAEEEAKKEAAKQEGQEESDQ